MKWADSLRNRILTPLTNPDKGEFNDFSGLMATVHSEIAELKAKTLASLHLTEETLMAPIKSDMARVMTSRNLLNELEPGMVPRKSLQIRP